MKTIVHQTVHSFRVCGQLYPRKNLSHIKRTFDQGKIVREEKPRYENSYMYNIPDKKRVFVHMTVQSR